MIRTAYCQDKPIVGAIAAARRTLSVQDQVEIEDTLQRWALWGPEDNHIYLHVDQQHKVLALLLPHVKRFLVAVLDLEAPKITVVSLYPGTIAKVIRLAFIHLGPLPDSAERNRAWTG